MQRYEKPGIKRILFGFAEANSIKEKIKIMKTNYTPQKSGIKKCKNNLRSEESTKRYPGSVKTFAEYCSQCELFDVILIILQRYNNTINNLSAEKLIFHNYDYSEIISIFDISNLN